MNTSISLRRVAFSISLGLCILFGATAARADEFDAALDAEIGKLPTLADDTSSQPAPAPRRDPATVGTTLPDRRTVTRLPNSDAERSTLVVTTTYFRLHSPRHDRRHASR